MPLVAQILIPITVQRLDRPVHAGDWHDKPMKWECTNGITRQLFSTKADAMHFSRLWKRHGDMNSAIKVWSYETP